MFTGGHRRQLARWENLAAELKRRNYPEVAIGKILGGNLLQIMRQVLPIDFLMPGNLE